MLFDLSTTSSLPNNDLYDVCIAGGGVAGITIARKLAEKGKRVLLLEGGGLDYSDESQELYQGVQTGKEYFDLDITRLRYLGGTSNHWAGWCRPLDPYDFEKNPAIPDSGWAISYDDVKGYQSETSSILEIDEFPDVSVYEQSNGHLIDIEFLYSTVRFGEKYLGELRSSKSIDLVINANVTDAKLDTETGQVTSLTVRSYGAGSPESEARAKRFVIAMGGLENPRFLLNANKQLPNGLGNDGDQVGRYFMEHLIYELGNYVIAPQTVDQSGLRHIVSKEKNFIAPTREFIRTAGIPNCALRVFGIETYVRDQEANESTKKWVKHRICDSSTLTYLYETFVADVYCRKHLPLSVDTIGLIDAASEQVPNPSSRVTLADDVDALGMRRISLNWETTKLDKDALAKPALECGKMFARTDFGRIKLHDWLLTDDADLPDLSDGGHEVGGHHHMGTTRMGLSAQDGVVDANCKVFGTENLYMAGSSVFRTGGHANPTYTIVQLSLRLADHLATLT